MNIPDDIYDPCPCGSGKKYKFCCQQRNRAGAKVSEFEWVKLRQTEALLTEVLFKFAGDNFTKDVMGKVWNEFAVGQDFGLQDSPEFEPLFTPWFLFNWKAPEKKITIGELFLGKAKEIAPYERKFIESMVQRPYSFYLVEGVEPGVSLTLKGLLLPEEFVVKERQASQTVEKGYIVFCRVLPWDNCSIMVGSSPYLLPPNYHYGILDLRDTLKKRCGSIGLDDLHKYGPEIRRVYFEFAEAIKNPRLPEMCNTDGDPIALVEVRYELKCSPYDAFCALSSLALFRSTIDILEEAIYDDQKQLHSVTFDWTKAGNKAHSEWDNTVLGSIKINGSKLNISVNSEKRLKKIKKEIEKRLGNKAVFQITTYDSIERKLKESKGKKPYNLQEENDLMNNPEVQEQMKKMMEAHWKKWFDEPIPALKGKTPRQASKTKEGRERLEALLIEYEMRDQKTGRDNFLQADIKALRKELGLSVKVHD